MGRGGVRFLRLVVCLRTSIFVLLHCGRHVCLVCACLLFTDWAFRRPRATNRPNVMRQLRLGCAVKCRSPRAMWMCGYLCMSCICTVAYACERIYTHVYTYKCRAVHVHTCACTNVCIHMRMQLCMYVPMYAIICACAYAPAHMWLLFFVFRNACVFDVLRALWWSGARKPAC